MAFLWCDGCLAYGNATELVSSGKYASAGAGYSATGGRFGGPCLTLGSTGTSVVNLTANAATLIAGRATNLGILGSGSGTILAFRDNGTTQVDVRPQPDGAINVTRNGTLLASSPPGLLTTGRWYYIEFQATINPTTGAFDVWIDGTLVTGWSAANSGVNTRATANSYANQFVIGNAGTNTDLAADMYVLDTTGSAPQNARLGDIRIDEKRPGGAGYSTNFTPSAAPNYQCVDDPTGSPNDGDSTYVESSTVGHVDSYAMTPPLPTTTGTIFGLCVTVWARKTDASARSMRARLRAAASVATNALGAAFALGVSYVGAQTWFTVNPETTAAFTASELDASTTEIGIEVVT